MQKFDLSDSRLHSLVSSAISGADDGELFFEESESEILVFDDSRLKTASLNTRKGFGLRALAGEACLYASSNECTKESLLRALDCVSCARNGYSGHADFSIPNAHKPIKTLYEKKNPLHSTSFEKKVALLQELDSWARTKNPDIQQITLSFASSWQTIKIVRPDGFITQDHRPLRRINISIVVGKKNRQEAGTYGMGGRSAAEDFFSFKTCESIIEEALRQARVNLESIPSPAGTFDVVLANGWPGVMLHEAVGHGLESDFNRKKTSAFSGLLGTYVAAKNVTIVDDGSIPEKRGSIHIDDEGTPSQPNILIENGKLVGYMHDRQNARLMGMIPTGNGRRESYACQPMPRMTNTFMMNGHHTREEIIASVKNGIYAVSFGGGQVDITSGKFVFSCTEAYKIENGKVTNPLKGAMLIGDGPQAMQRIALIGNDTKLDPGIGTCGKAGQNIPVCVGQPHLRINAITVGGTTLNP